MAPPAQPRNVLYGQAVSTIIAILFTKLLEDHVTRHVRVSFTTASAIAAMVLLGIPHPPAGATALILSRGNFNWNSLGAMILSNLIAVIVSTCINNISEKRQYPTFLYVGESYIYDIILGCCAPEDEVSTEAIPESLKLTKNKSILKEGRFTQNNNGKSDTSPAQSIYLQDPIRSRSTSPIIIGQTNNMMKSTSFVDQVDGSGGSYSSYSRPITIPNKSFAGQGNFSSRPLYESKGSGSMSFVQSVDQIQNSLSSQTLLAPMDWSRKSSQSSRVQITGDEEDANIGMDFIENEASKDYDVFNNGAQISAINDLESGIVAPFTISSNHSSNGNSTDGKISPSPLHAIISTHGTDHDTVQSNQTRKDSMSQLSPLKETDDEKLEKVTPVNNESYQMPGITYGNMFMMPGMESNNESSNGHDDLDDDLSLLIPRVQGGIGGELSDDLSLESLDAAEMF